MATMAGAPVSERAQRRMRPHFSLQEWLDTEASKYAWALTIISVVSRGASFYSGSAAALTRLLGVLGMRIFDGVSGIGIAFGSEMLTSIAGRSWQRNSAAARMALGDANLKRAERASECARYQHQARIDFIGMCIGIFGTTVSSFMFMFTGSADHSFATVANEVMVTIMLVAVMVYLGVFNTTPHADPAKIAQGQAMEIRSATTDAAGQRIASGVYSPDDVYAVAAQLPKSERDRFIAALVRPEPEDPMWGTREMADWLGLADLATEQDEAAARRRLIRLLAKVAKDDARIQKNEKGQYQVPRSLALTYLAEFYIELHRAARRQPADWLATLARRSEPFPPSESSATASQDAPSLPA